MVAAVAGTIGVLLVLLAAGLSGLHRRYFAFLADRAAAGGGGVAEAIAAARTAPFGLPDGTIRATLALLLVVAGVLALLFRRELGDAGTGELVSLLGTVVGFYFGARGTEAAAAQEARRAVEVAQAATTEAATARVEAASARAAVGSAPALPTEAPAAERDRLAALRERLSEGRRVLAVLASAPGGPPLVEDADAVLARVDATLAAVEPLLAGRADAVAVAAALARGGETLEALDRAGLPGLLGDAIATVGGSMRNVGRTVANGATMAAAIGGPAGFVAALALGGLSLMGEHARFEAWTRRVLDLPPRFADLPDRPNAVDAAMVVDAVPGLRARLSSGGTLRMDLALTMLQAAATGVGAGGLQPADAVAATLTSRPEIAALFPTPGTLAETIAAMRRAAAFGRVPGLLPATVTVPGAAPVPVDTLLDAIDALRTDPHAAAEIDRVASLVGTLGEAGLDVRALLEDGLAKGADLARRERQSTRGAPEAVR